MEELKPQSAALSRKFLRDKVNAGLRIDRMGAAGPLWGLISRAQVAGLAGSSTSKGKNNADLQGAG
jgi:hypothetical protein